MRGKFWVALALLCLGSIPVNAQAQRIRSASDQRSLLAKLQWVHFSIIGGRIQGIPSSFGSTVSTHHLDPITGRTERIAVNVTTGAPAVHYESLSKREQVIIDVTGIDQLRIRRVPIDQPLEPPVEFTQESSGTMLLLAIGEGEQREEFRAPGIWQLMLAHPELCAKHLTPLLELLRPEWRLSSAATSVEETLVRTAQTHELPDVSRWAALVNQLGADQFAPRQQAEKQLRRAGQSVLPYLHSLDLALLSAEQRYRVRRLRHELLTAEDDNPERISTWLLTDSSVWLSLLQREDAARRRAAAAHLTLLLGGPIDFDPDADAAARAAQWDALSKRVAKKS